MTDPLISPTTWSDSHTRQISAEVSGAAFMRTRDGFRFEPTGLVVKYMREHRMGPQWQIYALVSGPRFFSDGVVSDVNCEQSFVGGDFFDDHLRTLLEAPDWVRSYVAANHPLYKGV